MSKQTVVIAIDESEHSRRALDYYLDYLHRPDNMVVLAHCIEMPYIPAAARPDIISQIIVDAKAAASKIEAAYIQALTEKGVASKVLMSDVERSPGQFVVDTAQKEKAGMIVIGTRGMGMFRRTIMGSVSDYVVHHAHCPTLVCRK